MIFYKVSEKFLISDKLMKTVNMSLFNVYYWQDLPAATVFNVRFLVKIPVNTFLIKKVNKQTKDVLVLTSTTVCNYQRQ